MAEDESTFDDFDGRRDYQRVALVVVTLLAVLLATIAVPALSPAGAGMPASSLVPIPEEIRENAGGGGAGGNLGGLGALSPGDRTQVGGSLGGESALRSTSDEVHFRVESTQPTYMRTGAYGEYTGEGWERRDDETPIDGQIPVSGQRGTEVSYEVTLERGAAALPTVWQPARVSREDVTLTANGAVRADRTVPGGTSYTGVSYRPPDDPALLRQAGQDYPDEIEDRYTQLPDDRPERLARFTDELTANATSAYEEARAIERFLEADKTYSLNASHDPDDPAGIATQFVFDMDEGYCEYFATSMVAMLRTQDIPARYVVGYSTGEEVSEDTYVVRGMNAHAWVEVYFSDVGWVRFDPTPGDERRQRESEELDLQTSTPTPAPTETQTPTETATETPTPTPTETDDGYSVALNPEPTPGATVTVTVTDDGVPVADARVLFNGESVGTTDRNGNVTAQVPYERTLNVTVESDSGERVVSAAGVNRPDGWSRVAGPTIDDSADDGALRIDGVSVSDTETYELNTTARLVLTGSVHTGSEVRVTALVAGEPVPQGTVTVDGTRIAITDEQGRATITLPPDPGEVTIGVRRGAVSGNRTVTLGALNVTVEPTAPLALPYTGARVNATVGDDPAANATVTLDGERIGTTGVDGTATVTLPQAASATVGVSRYGQSRTAEITGLYRNLGLVVGGAVLVLLVAGVLARRNSVTPRSVGRWLVRAGRWSVGALVALAGLLDRALVRCYRRAILTVAHFRDLLAGRVRPSALLAALRAWFDDRTDEVETTLSRGVDAVASVTDNGEDDTDAHATIRDGWATFLDHVSLARPGRRTPEAIAAHAIEVDDLPAEAVWALVDSFRAVEYGKRAPDERVPAVDEAVAAIQRAAERVEDTDGSDAGGTDTDGEAGVAD